MMASLTTRQLQVLLAVAALLLFVPGIGAMHLFDWDEINFAESAREMLVTGDFFRVRINYQPFWEKPPLFMWMQAFFMSIFGVGEFAARLPNALCGAITLPILFTLGEKHFGRRMGLLWAAAYACSILPHLYFKSGIIDPWFNLFIFLGVWQLPKAMELNKLRPALLSGIFIGLAVLTKGPVALLVMLLSAGCIMVIQRKLFILTIKQWLVFFAMVGLVSSLWYGAEMIANGPWFLVTFIEYQIRLFSTQDAGHGGPFIYHWVILLLGCFPASVFIIPALRRSSSESAAQNIYRIWMVVLFFVVLILFSIVKTKIVHYSSLCYFPLTFLAALALHRGTTKGSLWHSHIAWLGAGLGVLIGLVFLAFPILVNYKSALAPLFDDPFAVANLLADVDWPLWLGIHGVLLVVASALFGKHWHLASAQLEKYLILFFITSLLCLQWTIYTYTPRIEQHSQHASLAFLKEKSNEDVYTEVLGYKSYAQYFYGARKLPQDSNMLNRDSLLGGKTDKPVWFVTKIDREQPFREMPQLKRVSEKNGFVFYYKEQSK